MEGIGMDLHAKRDDLEARRNWCRGKGVIVEEISLS